MRYLIKLLQVFEKSFAFQSKGRFLYETIVGCMLCDIAVGNIFRRRTRRQDILLGTEESVTEEVSGEIPVLKSESENVKQEESEEKHLRK